MVQPTDPGRPTPGQDPEFSRLAELLRPGQMLWDRYRLSRRLGAGGFGVVWLALDEALGMEIALKFLGHSIVHSPDAIDDLKRETRMSLRLTHPSIVRIYGFHTDDELAAISMEYVDGGTLAAVRRSRPERVLEPSDLEPIVGELCHALDYAHGDVKVVHRDLKPGNLMLNSAGHLKVTDFGISSTISETQSRLSMRRSSAGTPAYMSPQQMLGRTPTVSDDIYALGATLFDLLTGKPPFYQGDIGEQVRSVEPPALGERRRSFGITSEVPEAWERAIAACLRKEPDDRPPSALALLELLGVSNGSNAAEGLATLLPERTLAGDGAPVEAPTSRGGTDPSSGSVPQERAGVEPPPGFSVSPPLISPARPRARRVVPIVGVVVVLGAGILLARPLLRARTGGDVSEPVVPASEITPDPAPEKRSPRVGVGPDESHADAERAAELAAMRDADREARAELERRRIEDEAARRLQDEHDAARRREDEAARRLQEQHDAAVGAALASFEGALQTGGEDFERAAAALAALERLRAGDAENARLARRLESARDDRARSLAVEARHALDRGDEGGAAGYVAALAALAPAFDGLDGLRTEVEMQRGIRELVARFVDAKRRRDADGFLKLFRDPEELEASTRRSFADLESQSVTIGDVRIQRDGESAAVSFPETVDYKPRSGSRNRISHVVTLDLVHEGGSWLVRSVSVTR